MLIVYVFVEIVYVFVFVKIVGVFVDIWFGREIKMIDILFIGWILR